MPASNPARSSLSRCLALGLSLAVAMPVGLRPLVSHARAAGPKPAPAETAPAEAEDPALEEARVLYDQGKARFDTFDYEGALELWTQAYAKLPEDAAAIRNRIVYNIATAQEKAFELDGDVRHLRQAVKLLETYIDNYKALYERTPETQAEVQKAEERIASLQARIDEANEGDVRPPPPVAGASGDPPDPALVERNKKLAEEERKTDRMLIASYVTLSVGTLFTLYGLSAIAGARQIDEGEMEMAMTPPDPDADSAPAEGLRGSGYGGLALGLAGLVAGFTLLGVGLDRRKKAKQGTLITGAPAIGPGFAGAGLRMRF